MSAAELEAAKQRIIDIDEYEIKPIKRKLTDLRAAGNEPNSMEIIILKVRNGVVIQKELRFTKK